MNEKKLQMIPTLCAHWLRQARFRALVLTIVVFMWSVAVFVAIPRYLGMSMGIINDDGSTRPPTVLEEVWYSTGEDVLWPMLVHFVFLATFIIPGVSGCWWLVAVCLIFLGTPTALLAAQIIEAYMPGVRTNISWEVVAPPGIAVALVWMIVLVFIRKRPAGRPIDDGAEDGVV